MFGNVERISAAEDGDRWRAVVHTVMYNLVLHEGAFCEHVSDCGCSKDDLAALCGSFVAAGKGKGHPRTGNLSPEGK